MTEDIPTDDGVCEKCGGSGVMAVHGGMFGTQECTRCDGTGAVTEKRYSKK